MLCSTALCYCMPRDGILYDARLSYPIMLYSVLHTCSVCLSVHMRYARGCRYDRSASAHLATWRLFMCMRMFFWDRLFCLRYHGAAAFVRSYPAFCWRCLLSSEARAVSTPCLDCHPTAISNKTLELPKTQSFEVQPLKWWRSGEPGVSRNGGN